MTPRRVLVLGSSGSGKTTLARRIGPLLGLPFFDLDDEFWLPGWVKRPPEDFEARVTMLTEKPGWVISGNYSAVQHLTMAKADLVVWLDHAFLVVLTRLVTRLVRQRITGELICNGNRQSLLLQFTRESLVLYMVRNFWGRRRRTLERLANRGVPSVRLRTQRQVEQWIQTLGSFER